MDVSEGVEKVDEELGWEEKREEVRMSSQAWLVTHCQITTPKNVNCCTVDQPTSLFFH